ncbi:MAG: nuclear transport factor 2 family protein [Myxococcota bacterium]
MSALSDVLARYAACVTAGDVDGIVSLYADDASIQIPANGARHDGIDAIRAFYRDNELAETLEITGPACVAGSEGAVPMRARIRQGGQLLELDVIDVAALDGAGRLTRLRAFFDLEGARPVAG